MAIKHFTFRGSVGIAGLVASAFLATCSCPRVSDNPTVLVGDLMPTLSGIAWLSGDTYVAVRDSRESAGAGGAVADRLGICTVSHEGRVRWVPLSFDIGTEPPPRDLEAIAADPRRPGRFLAVESGARGAACRLFTFDISGDDSARITCSLKSCVDLRPWTNNLKNIESMVVLPWQHSSVQLIIADRAAGPEDAPQPATISMVALILEDNKVIDSAPWGTAQLPCSLGVNWRSCSDLAAAPDGSLYASSCCDPGTPDGPFESFITRIGEIRDGAFVAGADAVPLTVHQLKVEGIALRGGKITSQPPRLVLATDDEGRGGRLLLAVPPR